VTVLYIVLPVHNRAPVTARFVASLTAQTFTDYSLVLVDDGCTDATVAQTQAALPAKRLTVLRGDGNLWWAGALQLAWRHLRDICDLERDHVLIVNDDIAFASDFLGQGLRVLGEQPRAAIQAIGVDRDSGRIDRGAVADLRRLRFAEAASGERANCLSTRGLIMSARTFLESGGLRPRWLPHYLSDYEFTMRLARRGAALVVDERFRLQLDLGLTGLGRPTATGLRALWAQSFSNRAKFNPVHWSAFVIMACPWSVVPRHLASIWFNFLRTVLSTMLRARAATAPRRDGP
jgi:GT2 family glycosyltransferase